VPLLHATQTRWLLQTAPFAHGLDCPQLHTPERLHVSLPGHIAVSPQALQAPLMQVSPGAQSICRVQAIQEPDTQARPFPHSLSVVHGPQEPEEQTSPVGH
jgi:hypothetical protein